MNSIVFYWPVHLEMMNHVLACYTIISNRPEYSSSEQQKKTKTKKCLRDSEHDTDTEITTRFIPRREELQSREKREKESGQNHQLPLSNTRIRNHTTMYIIARTLWDRRHHVKYVYCCHFVITVIKYLISSSFFPPHCSVSRRRLLLQSRTVNVYVHFRMI